MITARAEWLCDLCRIRTAITASRDTVPPGWAAFDLENPIIHRSFTRMCVCPDCLREIAREQLRMKEEKV